MKSKLAACFLVLVGFFLNSHAANAVEKYRVGDTLASFSAKDQHDHDYVYASNSVRLVLVTFAMNPGKAANAFFEKQSVEFLDQHQAIFISNIYGMPGFVRAFVMPKMRKYPHRILLADSKDFLSSFPEQEDKITVLRLRENGTIETIQFVDPEKELPAIFSSTK